MNNLRISSSSRSRLQFCRCLVACGSDFLSLVSQTNLLPTRLDQQTYPPSKSRFFSFTHTAMECWVPQLFSLFIATEFWPYSWCHQPGGYLAQPYNRTCLVREGCKTKSREKCGLLPNPLRPPPPPGFGLFTNGYNGHNFRAIQPFSQVYPSFLQLSTVCTARKLCQIYCHWLTSQKNVPDIVSDYIYLLHIGSG